MRKTIFGVIQYKLYGITYTLKMLIPKSDPNTVSHHANETEAVSSYGYHRSLSILIGYNKSDFSSGWESTLEGLVLYYSHQTEDILDPKQSLLLGFNLMKSSTNGYHLSWRFDHQGSAFLRFCERFVWLSSVLKMSTPDL